MNNIHIINLIYGNRYIDFFLDYIIENHTERIKELDNKYSIFYHIMTDDIDKIKTSQKYRELDKESIVNFTFITIPPKIKKYIMYKICICNLTSNLRGMYKDPIIMYPCADVIYSKGSFKNLIHNTINNNIDLTVMPIMRIDKNSVIKDENFNNNLSSRDLFKYIHTNKMYNNVTKNLMVIDGKIRSKLESMLYWIYEDMIICKAYHLHPIIMRYPRDLNIDLFNYTIDGKTLDVYLDKKVCIVGDSDIALAYEISSSEDESEIPPKKIELDSKFYQDDTGEIHKRFFSNNNLIFHYDDLNHKNVMKRIKKIYRKDLQ